MARRGQAGSIAQDVYRLIRSSIFSGELEPGARIQPAQLGAQYGASTTVVREALQLLVGERLVRADAGKGFFVPEVGQQEAEDVTQVRCVIDGLALRMSIERGDLDWESEVIAAHHRLVRTPRESAGADNHQSEEWAEVHRAFHRQLVSACGSPTMLEISDQLQATTELIRVSVGPMVRSAKRNVAREHELIVEAVLARDPDLAVQRLTEHYEATARLLAGQAADSAAGGTASKVSAGVA
ncbi:MAG TPA: GntR family transcriptional regulator [Actinomycetales bacterium]|nr:GntR family transcriptional regulator [Actinomycetales bacterium]